jgi:hypothetical protein
MGTEAPLLAAPHVRALASLRARVFGVRPVTKKRRAIALSIALAADTLQLVLWPAFAEGAASPFDDALDLVVGAALWAILGMSPRLALAFGMELVPGADLFPTWTAVVLSIPVAPVLNVIDTTGAAVEEFEPASQPAR